MLNTLTGVQALIHDGWTSRALNSKLESDTPVLIFQAWHRGYGRGSSLLVLGDYSVVSTSEIVDSLPKECVNTVPWAYSHLLELHHMQSELIVWINSLFTIKAAQGDLCRCRYLHLRHLQLVTNIPHVKWNCNYYLTSHSQQYGQKMYEW